MTNATSSYEDLWICSQCGHRSPEEQDICPACKKPSDPRIGKIIAGTYRLIRKLAQGGMGSVYLAEHTQLRNKKLRAVKLVHDQWLQDVKMRQRFLREVEVTHLVSQETEHIVHIHDAYGFEDGVGYYVMEFLEGVTLEERLQQHPRGAPLLWSRKILLQICEAMQIVHEKGLIHRDLKPANIFLIQKRGEDFTKIVDFGIAKPLEATANVTNQGAIVGTPAYISPEQIHLRNEKDLDRRCDIYSLGIIFFEMVTGRTPFLLPQTSSPLALPQILTSHLMEAPPLPAHFRPSIPTEWESLILRMLSKAPSERPQTMKEVADALLSLPAPEQDAPASFDIAHAETFVGELPKFSTQSSLPSPLPISAKESGVSSPLQSLSAPTTTRTTDESSVYSPQSPPSTPLKSASQRSWFGFGRLFFLVCCASAGFFLWQQMSSPPSHQHIPPQNRLVPSANRPPVVSPSSSTPPAHPTQQAPKQAPQKSPVSAPPTQPPQPEPVPNQTDRQTPPLPSSNNEQQKTLDKGSPTPPSPPVQTPTQPTRPVPPNKRRWLKIPFELPAQHRLRIASGNDHARVQKKAILLRQGHPAKLELLHISGQRFSYHPCIFQPSNTTQSIKLTPLLSTDEFKPDRIDYCLKSAPEEN